MRVNEIEISDAMAYMKDIPDKFIDLTITDIPYGKVNRPSNGLRNLDKGKADVVTFDLEVLVCEFCRVTRNSIYVFCGTEQVSEIRKTLVKHGLSTRTIIWEKTNPSPMNGDKIWLSGIEMCVFGKYPKAPFNGHCLNTVLRYPCGRNKIHPTQKPISLIEKLVNISSNPGDIILDPFMGSGTTAVAALMNGRKFTGCDIDPQFVELARLRVQEVKERLNFYDIHELLDDRTVKQCE